VKRLQHWFALAVLGSTLSVQAGVKDNRYEGNIFVIYGGNGYIIPPRTTLEASVKRGQPVMLIFYVNDSKDCKAYTPVITRLQVQFEREVNFIALHVDSLPEVIDTAAGRYYTGQIPYTVLFDRAGKVVYQAAGMHTYNQLLPYFNQMVVPATAQP